MLPPRFGAGQLIVVLAAVLVVLGAMAAREISPRLAAGAAVLTSLFLVVLTWWFHRTNVHPPVTEGYGMYLGAGCALAALAASLWALASALLKA